MCSAFFIVFSDGSYDIKNEECVKEVRCSDARRREDSFEKFLVLPADYTTYAIFLKITSYNLYKNLV